jgi:hypothetical protein
MNASKFTQEVRKFDPYGGTLLSAVVRQSGARTKAYLVFPTGDLGQELSELLGPDEYL